MVLVSLSKRSFEILKNKKWKKGNDPGPSSSDISFQKFGDNPNITAYDGTINEPEVNSSPKVEVAYVTTAIPGTILLEPTQKGIVYHFISAFRTSLDSQNPKQDALLLILILQHQTKKPY